MNLYEKYHLTRKLQKRVISKNDFTYRTVLSFAKKYENGRSRILDIGCGVGTVSLYLGANGKKVCGIDISRSGILVAKQNAKNFGLEKSIKFSVIDFPKVLPRKTFDLIICSEVLEHIRNDKMAVVRMNSILRKGGVVIASSPSLNAPLYKMGLLKNFDREVGHLRRYKEESFKNLFEAAEFKVLETKKTEGILRNFLFTNSFGGFLLRVLNKRPFSEIVTFLDNLTISLFGESNIYLVAQKQ